MHKNVTALSTGTMLVLSRPLALSKETFGNLVTNEMNPGRLIINASVFAALIRLLAVSLHCCYNTAMTSSTKTLRQRFYSVCSPSSLLLSDLASYRWRPLGVKQFYSGSNGKRIQKTICPMGKNYTGLYHAKTSSRTCGWSLILLVWVLSPWASRLNL